MAALPTGGRDMPALMAETPGVASSTIDVGGSAAMNQLSFVIYGMTAGSALSYIRSEGVVASGLVNQYNDFGSLDEVQIETAAHTAEMPLVGAYVNMIMKSGGNAYHVTFYKDYETSKWGATNIDAEQIARGVRGGPSVAAQDINKVLDYQDTNAGI